MLKYNQDTINNLYINYLRGESNMPNHCHNRVTFSRHSDSSVVLEQIAEIKQMFEDENCFTQIIPEPDWPNTPNKDGELPVQPTGNNPFHVPWFKSADRADDRWYDWRIQNWDTKWDAYDVVVTDDDPQCLEIEFNTAWSPPEAICHAIREQYEDVSISWFYDEPGMEIAGYL